MEKLLPLVRISAKKSFQILRKRSPVYCRALHAPIEIGKVFFKHISFARHRKPRDLIERLLIIPFLEDIISEFPITEFRDRQDGQYYKLSATVKGHTFSIIIKKVEDHYHLISCFREKK